MEQLVIEHRKKRKITEVNGKKAKLTSFLFLVDCQTDKSGHVVDSVNIDFISVFDQDSKGYFSFGWETLAEVKNWKVYLEEFIANKQLCPRF